MARGGGGGGHLSPLYVRGLTERGTYRPIFCLYFLKEYERFVMNNYNNMQVNTSLLLTNILLIQETLLLIQHY